MTQSFEQWQRRVLATPVKEDTLIRAGCNACGSRTCDGGEALCVAHEDFVPYQDDDQRLGGWDNPYQED